MSAFTPTGKGFRLIFRRLSIPFAEIAWRWSFALAVWFLCGAFLLEYANTLPVDAVDRLLLGTQQPALILRALQRIFHGSGLRFTESGILLAAVLALAWIVLTSLGRVATLKAIVEEFGLRDNSLFEKATVSLLALNFLRAAALLAAAVAVFGAAFLASGVWASTHLSAVGAVRLWILFVIFIWFAWVVLNWILATASIFVVSEGRSALEAVATTVRWLGSRFLSVIAAGAWFWIAHAGAFTVACSASLAILGFAQLLGSGLALIFLCLIALVYCAVADFLYIGRLAAYLWIAREDELDLVVRTEKPVNKPGGSAVDQTELILSDVPVPAI
jgi:hypothetical protein